MISVVPSLPAATFGEIESLANALTGIAQELQIDIVDGQFVPLTTWPFNEQSPATALKKLKTYSDAFNIEVDCMVLNPEQYLDIFLAINIKRLIVHMRSTDKYDEIIAHAKEHGYQVGLALTNDVPLSELQPYISRVDFVQIMGIKHVGQQGQPFDERTLETARTLRDSYPELEIAVDGSVNKDTIVALKNAGVNRFAPGSAVAKQDNPREAYLQLVSLVSE